MPTPKTAAALTLLLCLPATALAADAAPSLAADLSADLAACAACHGEDALGREALAAPRLAGQHASYLSDQLRAYRAGARGSAAEDTASQTMRAAALALDDARIEALASHYAALDGQAPSTRTAPDGDAGAELYADHCATCHGAGGEGRGSIRVPNLALLERWYLDSQMQAYRDGARGASDASTTRARFMRTMAALLADAEEVDAVLTHIETAAP